MISLHKNEHVIMKARKHWLIFVLEALFIIVAGLLPIFFTPFLDVLINGLTFIFGSDAIAIFSANPETLFAFIYSGWLLVTLTVFFLIWTDYYLDVWIVTNQRIFDIEQKGIFNRNVSSFRLRRIQDVTVEMNGIIPTLLKFGTIHVQTAGAGRNFEMRGMANPRKVKRVIFKAHGKAIKDHIHDGLSDIDG